MDRMIIVITADHDIYFDLADDATSDQVKIDGVNVPCLIDHPKLRKGLSPLEIDIVTSHVDLGPTLLDMYSQPMATTSTSGAGKIMNFWHPSFAGLQFGGVLNRRFSSLCAFCVVYAKPSV